MKNRVLLLLAAMCPVHMALGAEEETARLPNIVFFFCDDLGYADIGAYEHPYAKTPTLDKLAIEGTIFRQHYVTGVTCNPSRTGLMTGRFPARFQKYAAFHGFGERVSITELLHERGYKIGHFGKWNIGPDEIAVSGTYGLDVVDIIGKSKDRNGGRDDDLTTAAIEFMRDNAGKQPLYDLSVDPSESRNVARENPDVSADLKARLMDWFSELPKSYLKKVD